MQIFTLAAKSSSLQAVRDTPSRAPQASLTTSAEAQHITSDS